MDAPPGTPQWWTCFLSYTYSKCRETIYRHGHHLETVSASIDPLVKKYSKLNRFKTTMILWCLTLILFTKLIASSNSTGFFTGGCSSSSGRVISYPFGKKVLNPRIRSRWPLNNCFTLAMTPAVSVLQSQHIAKKILKFTTKNLIYHIMKHIICKPLSLKIFHDFKKLIVFFPLVLKYVLHRL